MTADRPGQSLPQGTGMLGCRVEVEPPPLETAHAFEAGDPEIWGPRCRLCWMLPTAARHGAAAADHDPGDEDRGAR